MTNPDTEWHLDKKVPIGLLVTIVIQTITLVYVGTTWKSAIDNRIANLEAADVMLQRVDESRSAHATRLTILEQKFDFISQTLTRIENKIDKEGKTP